MEVQLQHQPGNAAALVTLAPDESFTAEAGAMVTMSHDVAVETTTHKRGSGGMLRAAKRLLAGESFFLNHFTAGPNGGHVMLAATLAGDMLSHRLDNQRLIVQSGSFVACESGVSMDLGWQGFKSLFSGESLFWLNLSGTGQLVLSSFGAIYPVEVDGSQIVDTGHIVAFEESLQFSVTKAAKGWIGSFLSGEGLVCRFQGHGTVWCQSHNAGGFGHRLGPMLKSR